MFRTMGYMGDVVTKPPIRAASKNQGYVAPPMPGDLPAANPESKTTLYIGLGIGALVVLGGAYFLLKS